MRRVHVNGERHADGLLHRPVDYASGGFIADSQLHRRHGHQRLAAAVPRPQQRPRRLEQRRLEPGVLRRHRRAGPVLPGDGGLRRTHTRRWPPRPVTEEEPFLYIDDRGNYSVFVPALQTQLDRPVVGDGPDAGTSLPISTFFIANAGDHRDGDQPGARARQEPDADAGRLRPAADDPSHARRTRVVLGLGFADARPAERQRRR